MKPASHLMISAVGAAPAAFWPENWTFFAAFALVNFLVDADHVPDCILAGGWDLRYKSIHDRCVNTDMEHVFVLFHAWEFVIAGAAVSAASGSIWGMGASAGLFIHLLCDQVTNTKKEGKSAVPMAYFLTYRILQRFRTEKLFPPNNI